MGHWKVPPSPIPQVFGRFITADECPGDWRWRVLGPSFRYQPFRHSSPKPRSKCEALDCWGISSWGALIHQQLREYREALSWWGCWLIISSSASKLWPQTTGFLQLWQSMTQWLYVTLPKMEDASYEACLSFPFLMVIAFHWKWCPGQTLRPLHWYPRILAVLVSNPSHFGVRNFDVF